MSERRHQVVVVGGGFGGIRATRALATDAFGMKFTGVTGYTMWGFVHVLYLIGWGNRIAAVFNWARALTFSKNRPHRTITYEHAQNELAEHHHQREQEGSITELPGKT